MISCSFSTQRHTTHYIECGPSSGPLMIFLHGWPSFSLMWRAQMEAFSADGWHCVAPDLRGYGGSSTPATATAYTIEEVVTDMTELHDHLGGQPALWVGHDWGCVVASSLAAHNSERARALVLTSLAYFPTANALPTLVPLVDRSIYPIEQYPDGQWDYYRFYTTNFETAIADLNADISSSLASIFTSGKPELVGKVSPNALVTKNGGRFGAAHCAPPTKPDPAIWPEADFQKLVEAFERTGFRPACSWYLNDDENINYARSAPNGGKLSQPILFINGNWDQICTTRGNSYGEPMRAACTGLTETEIDAGHWLPLERKTEHIDIIRNWLSREKIG